jgi:hypothetical protein
VSPGNSWNGGITRRALVLTRFQMARLLGADKPTWGTYEAGLQRIPVDQELSLSDWDRVTDLSVLQIG